MPLRTPPVKESANADPSGESGHGSRFGDLLIKESLITREQLAEALRVQSTLRNYIPLGQILVMRGWLTRTQLTTRLKRHRKRARLGELLVRGKHITTEQLETALALQAQKRQPLGQTLMGLGYVTEETIREALCAQLHINFFDLDPVQLDPALAWLVSEKYATKRLVVPLFRTKEMLVLAIDDPTDIASVEELQQLLRVRIEIVTSTSAKIQRAIKRLYTPGPRSNTDPSLHPNIMMGLVHDQEVADVAAKTLGVRILPRSRQSSSATGVTAASAADPPEAPSTRSSS